MGNIVTTCFKKSPCISDELKHEQLDADDATSNEVSNAEQNCLDEKTIEKLKVDNGNIELKNGIPTDTDEPLDPKYYYDMNHKKRGLALIFNHAKFDCTRERRGTEIDRDRLKTTLKSLDFDVKIYEDNSIQQIKDVLEKVAAMDHTDNDCLMIVVLTHGELVPLKDRKGKYFTTILTHDLFSYLHATDNKYPLQLIWEQFTDERCPTLKNKPRLFVISACQGDSTDEGYHLKHRPLSYNYQSTKIETDISPFSQVKYMPCDPVKLDRSRTLPQKDFLVMYSSMSGFYSYRDPDKGTWFINALCDELEECTEQLDLLHTLTSINRKVAIEFESGGGDSVKQMPCVVSMLSKLILFKKKKPLTNGFCPVT